MTDINKRLQEWNETIAEGEALRNDMRRRAMRMRDGWLRRATLRLAAFTDRWVQRGKTWRNEDISE